MFERKTTVSTMLLEILKSSSDPVSVSDILNQLEKGQLNPNKTTIYRQLEKLKEKQIVLEIPIKNAYSV